MSTNKKPRRKYRGSQNKSASAMPSSGGLRIINMVPKTVATNPVAQAVERIKLARASETLEASVLLAQDGDHRPVLIDDCINIIGLAILAASGWGLDDDVGLGLLDAINRLTDMGQAGCIWAARHRQVIADAVAHAAPIISAMPQEDKQRAAKELRELDILATIAAARERAEAAA